MENAIIFEPKSWWKDDIYSLLKRCCFQIFCDGKYGLFWHKKSMERWYLLITEKFFFWATGKLLFRTFRWWEIRSFFSQKDWCKVNIYLVFLGFPWYSRTWKIRFLVQWLVGEIICKFNSRAAEELTSKIVLKENLLVLPGAG